jgi:hypothetical protein
MGADKSAATPAAGRLRSSTAARPDALDRGFRTDSTAVLEAGCNLYDSQVLTDFHHDCKQVIDAGPRRAVINLERTDAANTKLVAALVALLRRAQAIGTPVEFRVSRTVRNWIRICRVEGLLQHAVAPDDEVAAADGDLGQRAPADDRDTALR